MNFKQLATAAFFYMNTVDFFSTSSIISQHSALQAALLFSLSRFFSRLAIVKARRAEKIFFCLNNNLCIVPKNP